MARPSIPLQPGDGAKLWQEVEQARAILGFSIDAMACALGLSPSAYRHWRRRGKMPQAAWKRFVDEHASVLDSDEPAGGESHGIYMEGPDWRMVERLGGGNRSRGIRAIVAFYKKHGRKR